MLPPTRSLCLALVIACLVFLSWGTSGVDDGEGPGSGEGSNDRHGNPLEGSPLWTSSGATHVIRQVSTNETLRARAAAFGRTVDADLPTSLYVTQDGVTGCADEDFKPWLTHSYAKHSSWIVLRRGDCAFVDKVRRAQRLASNVTWTAGVVIGDDGSAYDQLVTMFARDAGDVQMPSLFVAGTSYSRLQALRNEVSDGWLEVVVEPQELATDWPLLDTLVFICLSPLCTLLAVYLILHLRRRKMHLANILPPAYITRLDRHAYLPKDGVNTECVICLDTFIDDEEVLQLPCHHVYHPDCITKWLVERKRVCPICKSDVVAAFEAPTERTPLLPRPTPPINRPTAPPAAQTTISHTAQATMPPIAQTTTPSAH
ncbi:hypothetical protein PYCC9005_005775 [Savitreella phatthalungensis]